MASHTVGISLNQAGTQTGLDADEGESGLAAEIARLSDNLAQSEMQIAALNHVLEMMRAGAGGRYAPQPQALSA